MLRPGMSHSLHRTRARVHGYFQPMFFGRTECAQHVKKFPTAVNNKCKDGRQAPRQLRGSWDVGNWDTALD